MAQFKKQDIPFEGFSIQQEDAFSRLISQSLPVGLVVFDKELKIINANSYASTLIDVRRRADVTLEIGTDEKIWDNWQKILREVVQDGKNCRFEQVNYCSAEKKAVLQITFAPLIDFEKNTIHGGLMVLENVTEKADIQKQMANIERFAVLGKLAGKVAHELNNPIDGIMRYINLAKRTISQQGMEKPVEYLDHAQNGLKRMVHIITELLEFSRNRYSSFEETPIDKIIDDAVRFVEPAIKTAEVEILKQYESPLPKTRNTSLFQVFCNLLKNAVEAMPDGGTVKIDCKIGVDNTAAITFRDTGQGFAPENSQEIFEPFFTTKTGKGTGLGLAICKDILEKYGGKITAQNAPDKGSIFTVYLPLK